MTEPNTFPSKPEGMSDAVWRALVQHQKAVIKPAPCPRCCMIDSPPWCKARPAPKTTR